MPGTGLPRWPHNVRPPHNDMQGGAAPALSLREAGDAGACDVAIRSPGSLFPICSMSQGTCPVYTQIPAGFVLVVTGTVPGDNGGEA